MNRSAARPQPTARLSSAKSRASASTSRTISGVHIEVTLELAEGGRVRRFTASPLTSSLLTSCLATLASTVSDPATCRLILTGDFEDSVKARLDPTSGADYSVERGEGTVLGKTIYSEGIFDVLMPAGLFMNHAGSSSQDLAWQLIHRTVEHEGLHVRLKQLGESPLQPLVATTSPTEFLRETAKNIVEEFRVESAIDPASYPLVKPAGIDGELAHWVETMMRVAFEEYPQHQSVDRLWVGVLQACQDAWTRLGYVAAALEASKGALDPRPPHGGERFLWDELVSSQWTEFVDALRSAGPATHNRGSGLVAAESRMGAILHAWLHSLGFDLLVEQGSEAFYIRHPEVLTSLVQQS